MSPMRVEGGAAECILSDERPREPLPLMIPNSGQKSEGRGHFDLPSKCMFFFRIQGSGM